MATKRISRYLLAVAAVLLGCHAGNASPGSDQPTGQAPPVDADTVIHIDRKFIISTDKIIPSEQKERMPSIDFAKDTIMRVDISGRASIDGPEKLNDRLAAERAEKLKEMIIESFGVDKDLIHTSSIGEDWALFERLVRADDKIPGQKEVLDIIASNASIAAKEARLRKMWKGATWRYLAKNILPEMRYAAVAMHIKRYLPPPPPYIEPQPAPYLGEDIMEVVEVEEPVTVVEEPRDDWYRKMYIKTNAPAWALLWQNVGVEVDLAKHWSFALPVYWSPYNYGKQTLKFRTLTLMPEFRYWPKPDNMGFFVNAHFGLAYFNYAKDGEYRYQDHAGKTPAIGGGLGIGYRFYFCKNRHWTMEVAVGGGVYKLDYDVFLNTPSTNHGYLLRREKRTFYGLDQAALTFSYSFGLRKKGGNK